MLNITVVGVNTIIVDGIYMAIFPLFPRRNPSIIATFKVIVRLRTES